MKSIGIHAENNYSELSESLLAAHKKINEQAELLNEKTAKENKLLIAISALEFRIAKLLP
jgi:hypothetical protein